MGFELVAAARGLSAEELESRLAGDLDAILGKAMATDPSERYGTAGELRRDIDRHLGSFPIEARPANRLDHLRRFAHRHRSETVAAVVASLSLLAGTSIAAWQASTARAESARLNTSSRNAQNRMVCQKRSGSGKESGGSLRRNDASLGRHVRAAAAGAIQYNQSRRWCDRP